MYLETKHCIIGSVETKHNNFSKTLFSTWWEEISFKYEEFTIREMSGGMIFGWDKSCFKLENTVNDIVGNIWLVIEGKLHDIKM